MRRIARLAARVLPRRFVQWYRRRRALRKYLRVASWEIFEKPMRTMSPEELTAHVAARRDRFYQQIVKDVLDRADLLIQQLDRRVEGLNARHSNEIRRLTAEIAELREELEAVRATLGAEQTAAHGCGRP